MDQMISICFAHFLSPLLVLSFTAGTGRLSAPLSTRSNRGRARVRQLTGCKCSPRPSRRCWADPLPRPSWWRSWDCWRKSVTFSTALNHRPWAYLECQEISLRQTVWLTAVKWYWQPSSILGNLLFLFDLTHLDPSQIQAPSAAASVAPIQAESVTYNWVNSILYNVATYHLSFRKIKCNNYN